MKCGFTFFASILFSAAIAKLIWVSSDPLWEEVAVLGSVLTLVGIVVEFWAAAAILFVTSRLHAAWTGVSTHLLLLTGGGWIWLSGGSCNCFGDWLLLPSWVIGLYDIAAAVFFASIIFLRSCKCHFQNDKAFKPKSLHFSFGTQLGFAVGAFVFLFAFTTHDGLRLAGIESNNVVAEQQTNLNSMQRGETYDCVVRITNFGSTPIGVTGSMRSCDCMTVSRLPLDIPARESRNIEIGIRIPASADVGLFAQGIAFFIEGGSQYKVKTLVRGKIIVD